MAGSKTAVYAAIAGNTVVMLAKFGAFAATGSGAMLSEGIHSFADVGNQCLLAVGIRASAREADEAHPYGYARDRYVWALISAVGIFFLGCGVTVYHGIESLMDPHELENTDVAFGVLLLSLLIEGGTLAIAVQAVRKSAAEVDMSFGEYLTKGSDPMGVSVLLEDGAAVFGVCLAAGALALTRWTHNVMWDGIASIAIGLLLGAIAVFLIVRNRDLLLGRTVRMELRDKLVAELQADPVVESVTDVKATTMGTWARFKAEIEFDGKVIASRLLDDAVLADDVSGLDDAAKLRAYLEAFGDRVVDAVGDEIDRLEEKLQHVDARVKHIDLEAD